MASITTATYTFESSCKPTPITVASEPTHRVICTGASCIVSKDPIAQRISAIAKNLQVFFSQVFDVCGVDGRGSMPRFYVHWNEKNAQYIVESNHTRFRFNDAYAVMPDVVGHECTHALVHHFGQLHDGGQPGALNESISDVFGIAFRHWLGKNKNDWSLGGDLRNPSRCFTMTSFKTSRASDDNVHDNSRIPSHAFYCAVRDTATKSHGVFARIWFAALKDVTTTSSFGQFALTTLAHARLRTNMPQVTAALAKSWVHVGVLQWAVERPVSAKKQVSSADW